MDHHVADTVASQIASLDSNPHARMEHFIVSSGTLDVETVRDVFEDSASTALVAVHSGVSFIAIYRW